MTSPPPRARFVAWIEKRFPVRELIESQLTSYYAPKNFNVWYFFGVLALVVLVSQFATGIFLAMFYKPGESTAFDSVECRSTRAWSGRKPFPNDCDTETLRRAAGGRIICWSSQVSQRVIHGRGSGRVQYGYAPMDRQRTAESGLRDPAFPGREGSD